jgi:uncharacterized protein (UPF0332 family)
LKSDDINTLIKHRLDQAQTALDDAKFLCEGKRSSQSIVNRAYYAVFYAALALLQKIGKVPSKHTGVLSLFDTEFVIKGIFTKERSKDFHKFKTSDEITAEQAEDAIKRAGLFVASENQIY